MDLLRQSLHPLVAVVNANRLVGIVEKVHCLLDSLFYDSIVNRNKGVVRSFHDSVVPIRYGNLNVLHVQRHTGLTVRRRR